MAEDSFQMIISSEDYDKLQAHEKRNKELEALNARLAEENAALKEKNKDLIRRVYIREAFIDNLANEIEATFGEILGLEIVSSDITQSFYQDVVSHEQNGISSIELRHALEAFNGQKKQVFGRARDILEKFSGQQNTIRELEKKLRTAETKAKEASSKAEKVANSADTNKMFEMEQLVKKMKAIQDSIEDLQEARFKLDMDNNELSQKNASLQKEVEILNKKRETAADKSYVIKLMIDEYYGDLEKSLVKVGGLSDEEISTVVGNELKGIIFYIDNLKKKAISTRRR